MSATQGVKLDPETRARPKALGELRDRSPHWLMRKAIVEYLDREEAYEHEKREDLERWERYQLTGEAVPYETVRQWLADVADGKDRPCPR